VKGGVRSVQACAAASSASGSEGSNSRV
ncbi:hypothetical protein CLOP_g16171, partial [Closterium sp. NIES-67]